LIVYRGDAFRGGRNITGMLCVPSRFNHTAQEYLAMVAIDGD
jgi:hypothetical protein